MLDDHSPLVQKTTTKPKPPYFNSEVIAANRCRNQFRRKCYATKNPSDWGKYRQQRNHFVSLRRKATKEHFAKQCSAFTGNPPAFWSAFKPFLFSRKCQMSESIQLAEGKTIIQEQSKIADILNNHFLTISAPAVPDPKNHHSISTIKNNWCCGWISTVTWHQNTSQSSERRISQSQPPNLFPDQPNNNTKWDTQHLETWGSFTDPQKRRCNGQNKLSTSYYSPYN